jgi:hypothetical protein
LNIYQACVPDHLHHIDLGLFKYQLDFTIEILRDIGGTALQRNFESRLRQIPRFPGLKLVDKTDVLKVMTTADHRHLMKITIFALDDIFDKWNQTTCRDLCNLFGKFSKMYLVSRQESFIEQDLEDFEVQYFKLIQFIRTSKRTIFEIFRT